MAYWITFEFDREVSGAELIRQIEGTLGPRANAYTIERSETYRFDPTTQTAVLHSSPKRHITADDLCLEFEIYPDVPYSGIDAVATRTNIDHVIATRRLEFATELYRQMQGR